MLSRVSTRARIVPTLVSTTGVALCQHKFTPCNSRANSGSHEDNSCCQKWHTNCTGGWGWQHVIIV